MPSLQRFTNWASRSRGTYAASILRCGMGAIMTVFYALHFRQREFLWGPTGMIDWDTYARLTPASPISFLAVNSSNAWFEFCYFSALIVAICYTIGLFPRLMAIPFVFCTLSFYSRNVFVLDGGQNLLSLIATYLIFCDTTRLFVTLGDPRIPLPKAWQRTSKAITSVFHNFGILLIYVQICLLYYWSGFYKISGHKWDDGTALYYIMRTDEFTLPMLSPLIYSSATLVTLGTYATLVFQGAFPFLMWVRTAKPYLLVVAICFHTGIAILMGLVMFSITMVIADLGLVSDEQWRSTAHALSTYKSRLLLQGKHSKEVFPAA